jgi:alkaline phosphatase D
MHRFRRHRIVLSSLLACAAALFLLANPGCSDNGGSGGSVYVTATIFPQSIATGDPRPTSVVFWTRVVDPKRPGEDLTVTLEIAADDQFATIVETIDDLVAAAQYDHCVKVRVTGLSEYTTYYYRFIYTNEGGRNTVSNLGRTKTAPAGGADQEIRFAFFTCQDWIGRYYNSYLNLFDTYLGTADDIDFLLFMGDYIYENTGDPSFQATGGDRTFEFTDTAGAIERGDPGSEFYSARSLPNYRELYKIYRSDPQLQKLHENYPMISFHDDHEFSDDSWKDYGTYFDERIDEQDAQRKRDSERAMFEHMPSERGLTNDRLDIDNSILYPNTEVIYDTFEFGAHLDLFLTDYRTYRPDHIIPEDAFPGTILLDEATTLAALGAAAQLEPYIDIDDAGNAAIKATTTGIVTQLYQLEGLSAADAQTLATMNVSGNISARYIAALYAGAGMTPPLNPNDPSLPRGLGYLTMGKQDLFSDIGSRYLVSHDLLYGYSGFLRTLDADVDNALGDVQQNWLINGLDTSSKTWKIVASSVSMTPLVLDFSDPTIAAFLPPGFPPELAARLQLNADMWDGFPLRKQELLNEFSEVPGTMVIAGDIHASFICEHGDRSGIGGGDWNVPELTGAAVSSGTIQQFVRDATEGLGLAGVDGLVDQLDRVFIRSSETAVVSQPSRLLYAEPNQHGYVVVTVNGAQSVTAFHHYPTLFVSESYYDRYDELKPYFTTSYYTVDAP